MKKKKKKKKIEIERKHYLYMVSESINEKTKSVISALVSTDTWFPQSKSIILRVGWIVSIFGSKVSCKTHWNSKIALEFSEWFCSLFEWIILWFIFFKNTFLYFSNEKKKKKKP